MMEATVRLIDANMLKYDLEEKGLTADAYINAIDSAPTVDAEPVRRGEWVTKEIKTPWGGTDTSTCCGYCGKAILHDTTGYCPNCGAKMTSCNGKM